MRRIHLLLACSAALVGCSSEKVAEGDNPEASNAVSSDQSPRAQQRGAPLGAKQAESTPAQAQQMPEDMKSR